MVPEDLKEVPVVMAEAMLSSGTLFSDLDFLLAELEKISALKKLLESAHTGKEPSLKLIISGISKQVMALHGLLHKIESEFQHNVEMRTSLKELQDTVEKEQKEAQCFLEVLSSHSAWESCGFAETKKHDERHLVKGKNPAKASEIQGFLRKMLALTPEDLEEVPVGFAETKKHDERHLVKGKNPAKASEIQGFLRKMLALTPEDLEEVPVVMAEAMVSSGTLFSDLDFLLAELEKISALKKLLESAYTGKEPSLKLIISGISKQVIVVLGLLRKIESEFQHNVEMRTPLKELQDTEEKEQKEAQCFLEVLSSHSAWESCVFAETKKHGEVHLVKRKKTTKAPEIQGFRRELDTMVPEDLKEVPVVFAETKKHGEVHLVKRKKTTKAPEIQGFRRELDTMVPEDLKEVPVVFAETKKHGEVHLVKRKKTTKAPEIQGFRRELDTMVPEDLKEVPVVMAEAMLSSGTLFSDLDFLLAELEKISALKKLLESAYTGKRN
ncbi:SKA complex subunit 1 isoform 2-T2 [Amazona ochrocephala]